MYCRRTMQKTLQPIYGKRKIDRGKKSIKYSFPAKQKHASLERKEKIQLFLFPSLPPRPINLTKTFNVSDIYEPTAIGLELKIPTTTHYTLLRTIRFSKVFARYGHFKKEF